MIILWHKSLCYCLCFPVVIYSTCKVDHWKRKKCKYVAFWYLRLGPMVRSWTMRFEAKHERLKRLATSLGNFTNIPWTLALRHQLRQCYEISGSKHGHPSIEKSLEVGPGISLQPFYFPLVWKYADIHMCMWIFLWQYRHILCVFI